ncbi:unnamed protein product, partial [Rotaria sp. Silwood2]
MATISNCGTTRQKPRLDLNGYSYIMDRSTSKMTYWRCIKFHSHHCHARLHTCIITNNVITSPTDDTCKLDGTTLEHRKFNEQITSRALNTEETPDIITTHCYKYLSDPGLARLPSRDNIKRRIRKLRQGKNIVQIPNDPNFSIIPVQLTKTFRENQFLHCDTGPDGTFKVVPEIFYQLYIIYLVYRRHVMPVVYALLRLKDAETYKRLINEILKFALRWLPETIMLDFEQACIKANQTSFPTAILSDCYFHLRQNVHHKIQVLGHQSKYQDDPLFAHNIHKIAALTFLQSSQVIDEFQRSSMDLGDDYEITLEYFEQTYIVSIDNEKRVTLFQSIGLNEQKARETLKNHSITYLLETTINQAKTILPNENQISKSIGNLLYSLSTKSKQQIYHLHDYLIRYICEEKIKNEQQLIAAIDYLLTNPIEPIDLKALEESAGIGVIVNADDIKRVVGKVIEQNKTKLIEQGYDFSISTLLNEVRHYFKWIDGKLLKIEMDNQLVELLGPNDRS